MRSIWLLVLIMFLYGCSPSITSESNNVLQTAKIQLTPQQLATSDASIPSVHLKHKYVLKSEPKHVTNDSMDIITSVEVNYTIISKKDLYTWIQSSVNSGWIPDWYIAHDNEVKDVKDMVMLIKTKTSLNLIPEESDQYRDDLYLDKGQVVKIKQEYLNWYNVGFIQYEAANPGDRWIEKDKTSVYQSSESKEGRVKKDATIYDSNLIEMPDESYDDGFVRIVNEVIKHNSEDVYYEVKGASGFIGYIKKSDFDPNPFR